MKRVFAMIIACLLFSVPALATDSNAAETKISKKVITAPNVPPAIGPYSRAIQAGSFLFVSGALGMDAAGKVVEGGVAAEAEQSLDNIDILLKAAGISFDNVVKTTIFLTDMADFSTVNEVYGKRFSKDPPARSTVAVKALPRNGKVEIEVIAIVP